MRQKQEKELKEKNKKRNQERKEEKIRGIGSNNGKHTFK